MGPQGLKNNKERFYMKEIKIVLGWYKRESEGTCPVRELTVLVHSEEVDAETLKMHIAYSMGYTYPSEIDYRFFDISYDEVE